MWSHRVFQCIPLIPTASGKILTDKDRIGKREEQGRGGMSTQEGEKNTMKGSVKVDKDLRLPDTPVEWDILGLRYTILPWKNPA